MGCWGNMGERARFFCIKHFAIRVDQAQLSQLVS
jgi:hypothetical protein